MYVCVCVQDFDLSLSSKGCACFQAHTFMCVICVCVGLPFPLLKRGPPTTHTCVTSTFPFPLGNYDWAPFVFLYLYLWNYCNYSSFFLSCLMILSFNFTNYTDPIRAILKCFDHLVPILILILASEHKNLCLLRKKQRQKYIYWGFVLPLFWSSQNWMKIEGIKLLAC